MSDVTKYFYKGGLNCAESTLRVLREDNVIDIPYESIRLMSGFGGGMRCGSVCGSVVGAVAAIGAALGRTETDEDRKPSAKATKEFLTRFEENFGCITCRELQQKYVKEHELKSEGMYRCCTVFVQFAVDQVKEILRDAERETASER